MIINLASINNGKEMTVPFEFSVPFDEKVLLKNYNIVSSGNIHILGKASIVNKDVIVDFKYEGTLVLKCDRCLDIFEYNLEGDVLKDVKPETHSEIESHENDIYYYVGDDLDITRIVMDDIFLNLPIQMVCKTDCKGICATCGADLNESDCDCNMGKVDPRFEVLKDFFDKEEV